ncbi:cupin domain-containing protein [Oceanivirga salmonicida]|uniref:cupin domain-containing protein n=1 Tax=Oceanivirga salmonicida TaxID=1769291 RepID=UPI0012E25945|nr:cupin domain-containing protein [Oceanivirga salmonicida]
MKKVHESDFEYRFGDSGPKYLRKGPFMGTGIVVLKPGEDFPSHYHSKTEESFLVLEGEIDFYIDGKLNKCKVGNFISCEPGESHYLINRGDIPAKAVFILAPYDLYDKFEVDNPEIE